MQTGGGFWYYNKTVELTIKPQPFSRYVNDQGKDIDHEFIVRYKGHFGQDWNYYPHNWKITNDYNTIFFGLGSENTDHYIPAPHADFGYLSVGDQVDFQVQSRIGYYTFIPDPLRSGFYHEGTSEFTGQSSDWSNTQTISIPDGSVSISTSPTPSSSPSTDSNSTSESQQQEQPQLEPFPTIPVAIVAIGTVFIIVGVSLLVYFKKCKR